MINPHKIHSVPARCSGIPMCPLHEVQIDNMRRERDTALAEVETVKVDIHKAKHATSRARIYMAWALLVAAGCVGHSVWIAGVR